MEAMTSGGSLKRVLVLVLAMDAQPWRQIEDEGQRKTWAAEPHPAVPVAWLYGRMGLASTIAKYAHGLARRLPGFVERGYSRVAGSWFSSRSVRRQGDRLLTGVPETYLNTNAKNIAGLTHLLATEEFDYVFRTNTSSYVNLSMLEEYVQSLPLEGFYGGYLGERDGVTFASGTCTLMSRDVAQQAVNDPAWEYGIIDDVAMGQSMARAGIAARSLERIDLLSVADIEALSAEDLESVFVVRCKNSDDRAHDVTAMRRVHELYAARTASR